MRVKAILLVDDFRPCVTLGEKILQEAKYKLLAASSGEQALSFFSGTSINLVITDLYIKEMNRFMLMKLRQSLLTNMFLFYCLLLEYNRPGKRMPGKLVPEAGLENLLLPIYSLM